MKPGPIAARDLLHLAGRGALGTLLSDGSGQPFVSAIEFAPDADNAPVFLISRLAEHTKNLERDARVSLLLTAAADDRGLLAQARMTMVGKARRFEPTPALVARFLRYLPDAERYLALGDFGFFRLQVARARLIGGFGSMGWLGPEALAPPVTLAPEREAEILAAYKAGRGRRSEVLGLDREGIDLVREGRRERLHFPVLLEDGRAVEQLCGLLGGA